MKNILGIPSIQVKHFLIQTPQIEACNELNEFLTKHKWNIIDIQFIGQSLGQICAIVTYKNVED